MAWAQLFPAQWGSRNFPYLAGGVFGSLFTGSVDFTTSAGLAVAIFAILQYEHICLHSHPTRPDPCTATACVCAVSSLFAFAFRSLSFFISIKYLD